MTQVLIPKSVKAAESTPFSFYVHVPYCRVRCGYCDFNTYTALELKGTTQAQYFEEAISEVQMAKKLLTEQKQMPEAVHTVFFGGGTPTLLPATELVKILAAIRDNFGIQDDAEVSVEANPDSVDPLYFQTLKSGGFTRVSIGMQSAVPHVLKTLDRTHNPENVARAVQWAKASGLQVSVDLIYGTPGESLADWRQSLTHAISLEVDHLSAYALIIEKGTKIERLMRQGVMPFPDDDLQADMYELADEMLGHAGFEWYELSNWARTPDHVSKHNLAYWKGSNWWGVGPGAHSHFNGVRWWNVKHPAAYAQRIAGEQLPILDSELLGDAEKDLESLMLSSRLRTGIPLASVSETKESRVQELLADGFFDPQAFTAGSLVLTLKGRLLADAVVQDLTL